MEEEGGEGDNALPLTIQGEGPYKESLKNHPLNCPKAYHHILLIQTPKNQKVKNLFHSP